MTKTKQILGIFAILLIAPQTHATTWQNFKNKTKSTFSTNKSKIQNVFKKSPKIEQKKEIPATVNFNKKVEQKSSNSKITLEKHFYQFVVNPIEFKMRKSMDNSFSLFDLKVKYYFFKPILYGILLITLPISAIDKTIEVCKTCIIPKVNNGYKNITYNLGQYKAYQKALAAGATIIGLIAIIKGHQKNN